MTDRGDDDGGAGEEARLSRRTWMEWLGGATVVGLTSPWLAACVRSGLSGVEGVDGGAGDATGRAAGDAAGDSSTRRTADALPGDSSPRPPDAIATDIGEGSPSEIGPVSDGAGDIGGDANEDVWEAAGAGDGSAESCEAFAPAADDAQPVFAGWGERTVDPQNLAEILASWRLRIDGLVAEPLELDFCQLLELGLLHQVTDFHCVEGWSILDVPWDGLQLGALVELAKPAAAATHLKLWSVGGKYTETLELAIAHEPRTLLGLGVGGSTLPLKHGFPCRVVIPRLLGYKNAKYVERIELVDHVEAGYWSAFGYPIAGEVPPHRLREGKY